MQHNTAQYCATEQKNQNCATVEAVELEKQTPQKRNTFFPFAILFYCMTVTHPLLYLPSRALPCLEDLFVKGDMDCSMTLVFLTPLGFISGVCFQ